MLVCASTWPHNPVCVCDWEREKKWEIIIIPVHGLYYECVRVHNVCEGEGGIVSLCLALLWLLHWLLTLYKREKKKNVSAPNMNLLLHNSLFYLNAWQFGSKVHLRTSLFSVFNLQKCNTIDNHLNVILSYLCWNSKNHLAHL